MRLRRLRTSQAPTPSPPASIATSRARTHVPRGSGCVGVGKAVAAAEVGRRLLVLGDEHVRREQRDDEQQRAEAAESRARYSWSTS